MSKWYFCLIGIMLLIPVKMQAQARTKMPIFTKPADILKALQRNQSKISLALDSRRSFVNRQDVNMPGIRVGLDFDGLVRVGGGLYFLSSDVYHQFLLSDPATGGPYTAIGKLNFRYVSIFFEPVLLRSKRWEISIPLHLGIGDSYYEGAGFELSQPKTALLSEASLSCQYKILPWVGLSGGVGYRRLLREINPTGENLHAPIYIFSIKFFAEWVYLKIFNPERSEEW